MTLSPQHKKILEIHSDGLFHCSTEIEYIRDQRKRISELNAGGYVFVPTRCDGRCGKNHNARLFMRRLDKKPLQSSVRIIERDGHLVAIQSFV